MRHPTLPGFDAVNSITVKVIDHKDQRYPTCGDWIFERGSAALVVLVSRTNDWREAMAVAVHEIVEALLCIHRGVDQKLVDAFDIRFEERRADDSEPGDDPMAPYYEEHQIATNVERLLTTAFGLHWNTYNEHLGDLDETTERRSESVASHG